MRIHVKTLTGLSQGEDLGNHTIGCHDEWVFDPKYAASVACNPDYFSNTPPAGLGNSFYAHQKQFDAFLGQCIREASAGELVLDSADDNDCFDTLAFLQRLGSEQDAWLLVEISR